MITGIFTIILISVISGLIAYLGNQLGRYIGRKRLSVFKLRPRYTSTLFTIATGILISLLTITTAMILSNNVRIALFGMEKLKEERKVLEKEIGNLKYLASQGQIIYAADQNILAYAVKSNSYQDLKNELEKLINDANKLAVMKNNYVADDRKEDLLGDDAVLAVCSQDEIKKTIDAMKDSSMKWGVIIYAKTNAFYKKTFEIGINYKPNMIVFPKGTVISQVEVNSNEDKKQIFAQIWMLMKQQVPYVAGLSGMVKNPVSDSFGGSLSIETMIAKRDSIIRLGGWVKVMVVASRDIWTFDSLDVLLELVPIDAPEKNTNQ